MHKIVVAEFLAWQQPETDQIQSSKTTAGLNFNKWRSIEVNETKMSASKKGVFAGGDIVTEVLR